MAQKLLYDVTQTIPNQKFFSNANQKAADAFEPLNSSLAQSAEELCHW